MTSNASITAKQLGDAPRMVITNKRAHFLRILLLALLVLVPVLFVTQGSHERQRLDALAAGGEQTPGTVVGKSSSRSRRTIRYEFRADGRIFGGDARVSSDEY